MPLPLIDMSHLMQRPMPNAGGLERDSVIDPLITCRSISKTPADALGIQMSNQDIGDAGAIQLARGLNQDSAVKALFLRGPDRPRGYKPWPKRCGIMPLSSI